MAKILLLEDDLDLSRSVTACLKSLHHTVESATSISCARDSLAISDYDLLVLDWNLPDGEGIEVLSEYRNKGGLAPVLMLTAKSQISDKEIGFGRGADDYLTKPFSIKELELRLNSLLRRPRDIVAQELTFKDLTMHSDSYRIWKGQEELSLLPKEFALLEFFLRHPGQIFSTEQLLERVWCSNSESISDAVVTTVKRLRRKIDEPGRPSMIDNIRGVGYRLRKPE